MPAITIDPGLSARAVVPGLGWIEGRLEREPDPAGLAAALAAATSRAAGLQPSTLPAIVATRRAIKALGQDPARYRPSAEALLRRLAKGQGPPRILPVVDVGTLISLETGVSVGAYDTDRLRPPLVLRAGRPGERYEGVDGRPLELAGLPILADQEGPLGGPVRDSARSKVRPETRRVLVVLYGFAPAPVEEMELARAAERLRALAGLEVGASGLLRGG